MSSLAMPLRGQQRLELRLVDEVAADLVLEVGLPVDPDGVADVVLVVRRRVLVDLDEDDLRVVEVGLDPVGVDECVGAAHCGSFQRDDRVTGQWVAREPSRAGAADEQVDLAAEA